MHAPFDNVHDHDAQIARQLPAISTQQDSLAAIMLTRWLRVAVAHGPASLEVTHHHRQERWTLRWRASNHRPHIVLAPTLPELFVRLLAELPEAEQRHWTDKAPPPLRSMRDTPSCRAGEPKPPTPMHCDQRRPLARPVRSPGGLVAGNAAHTGDPPDGGARFPRLVSHTRREC